MTAHLLADKTAIIYGGGGQIGGAIARAYAKQGARVFLAGRTLSTLEKVAADIRAAGGVVSVATVDAVDEAQVDRHADEVAQAAGGIDISVNVISDTDVQGTPMGGDGSSPPNSAATASGSSRYEPVASRNPSRATSRGSRRSRRTSPAGLC